MACNASKTHLLRAISVSIRDNRNLTNKFVARQCKKIYRLTDYVKVKVAIIHIINACFCLY